MANRGGGMVGWLVTLRVVFEKMIALNSAQCMRFIAMALGSIFMMRNLLVGEASIDRYYATQTGSVFPSTSGGSSSSTSAGGGMGRTRSSALLDSPPTPSPTHRKSGESPPMTLTLLRSIGNALPPRHDPEQTITNLDFTLTHELEFPNLQKHWIVNRLIDPLLEVRVINMLEKYRQNYTVVPFSLEEYAQVPYVYHYDDPHPDLVHTYEYITLQKQQGCADYTFNRADKTVSQVMKESRANCFNVWELRKNLLEESIQHEKNIYVTNQNAVRNLMLDIGIYVYESDWVLPWDGNCFITTKGYEELYKKLSGFGEDPGSTTDSDGSIIPQTKYAFTPMARAQSNEEVLEPNYFPKAIEEPQLVFHKSAQGRFNEALRYGRRNKIEMINRLHIDGPWDKWSQYLPWEKQILHVLQPVLDVVKPKAKQQGEKTKQVTPGAAISAGFVTRLSSGVTSLEKKGVLRARGHSRQESMTLLLTKLDVRVATEIHGFKPENLMFYHEDHLKEEKEDKASANVLSKLQEIANDSIRQGPWSVTAKNRALQNPSGNPRDYYHSDNNELLVAKKTDQDRWDWMIGNTTALALAHYMTGHSDYAQTAARNVQVWFLKWKTRMNPNLQNCEIHFNNFTSASKNRFGVIELKDVYYLMDAIRILERGNFLTDEEQRDLRAWFRDYANWLESSEEGQYEFTANNHRGVFYDIQMVSISSYLNDTAKMLYYLDRSIARLRSQMSTNSVDKRVQLVHEMEPREQCEENQALSLQAWSILNRLGQSLGRDLYAEFPTTEQGGLPVLCRASASLVPYFNVRDQCSTSATAIMPERWWPLWLEAKHQCGNMINTLPLVSNPWLTDNNDPKYPPSSAYEMPAIFGHHDGMAPFWNLGMPVVSDKARGSPWGSGFKKHRALSADYPRWEEASNGDRDLSLPPPQEVKTTPKKAKPSKGKEKKTKKLLVSSPAIEKEDRHSQQERIRINEESNGSSVARNKEKKKLVDQGKAKENKQRSLLRKPKK